MSSVCRSDCRARACRRKPLALIADKYYVREPIRRIRYLTDEEVRTLLEELPEHLADMAEFSLATGLRRASVTRLLWSQVDLERGRAWVHPDEAKAKAIPVPLNDDAVRVVRKQVGKHVEFDFIRLPPLFRQSCSPTTGFNSNSQSCQLAVLAP